MQKFLQLVLLITSFTMLQAKSLNTNNMMILDSEGNEEFYVRIDGKGESCEVTLSLNGIVTRTDCHRITNSKQVKILCTKKKTICKTENEVQDYLKAEGSLVKQTSKTSAIVDTTGLDSLRQGMNYSDARQIILNSGWQGVNTRWQDIPEHGQDNDMYYNNGWQEVVSCAGTGTAPCRFEFQDINQKKLVVITEGECLTSNREYPKKGEKCDVSVSQWFFEQPRTADSNTDNKNGEKIKTAILEVINNGSNRLDYPMGAMPAGMAFGADAEAIAEYIAGGMKGEQPASFAVCGSCHGMDGKGNNGMTPNLVEFVNKKLTQNIVEEPKEEMTDEEACNVGNAKACASLGLRYKYGMDGEQNYSKAMKFYTKSCNGGYAKGCTSLAGMYRLGDGVEKDNIKAQELLQKGCELGDNVGCDMIKILEIEAKMPAESAQPHKEETNWLDKLQDTYDKLTQTVPKCSDESVIQNIHKLYVQMREENINNASESLDIASAVMVGAIPESISRIEMIRSSAYDKSIEKRSCNANAVFEQKGKEISVEITYAVQLNEQNSNEYYVFLEPDYIPVLSQKIMAPLLLFGK